MDTGNITAAIVNYGTPRLTRMAVWSLRTAYPDLPIVVVENGSPDDSADVLRQLRDEAEHLTVLESDRNLHHGPGLDLAIRHIDTEWVLLFDSDCILYRGGLLEAMLAESPDAYLIGERLQVDELGYGASSDGDGPLHPYVHPKCALVRRSEYLGLPPFEKHGVPCLRNQITAAEKGHALTHFPVVDYVYHIGRGTAGTYGYNLGLKGMLWEIRHRFRR